MSLFMSLSITSIHSSLSVVILPAHQGGYKRGELYFFSNSIYRTLFFPKVPEV